MYLGKNVGYNIVGEYDVSEIAKEIKKLDPAAWEMDASRQQMYDIHRDTKSIFINRIDLAWQGDNYYVENFFVNEQLNLLTDKIVSELEQHFNGKVGRTMYINLRAERKILPHRDQGYYLTGVHRCHIPIITNSLVDFILGDKTVNMKVGVCHEIDNVGWHGVTNKSAFDRIHLVVDIIPQNLFR